MYKEELYNKIDKFCNETDWGKYPTYEHALEEFIKGIIAEETKELQKENAELKKKVENLQKYLDTRNCYRECAETWLKLTEAKKLLKQFLEAKNGEDTYKAEWEAEQFLKDSEVVE